MKSGAPSTTGWSSPLKRTATAPALTPARSNTSRRRTPVHLAFPIAPFAHWPPVTRGWKNPRELPEHWLIAAISKRGSASTSAIDNDSGALTWPRTASRNAATSTSSGITAQCQQDEKLLVWREYPFVEDLERRLQQRRSRPLQDHLPLFRERRSQGAFIRSTRQGEFDGAPGPGRPHCERCTEDACAMQEAAAIQHACEIDHRPNPPVALWRVWITQRTCLHL